MALIKDIPIVYKQGHWCSVWTKLPFWFDISCKASLPPKVDVCSHLTFVPLLQWSYMYTYHVHMKTIWSYSSTRPPSRISGPPSVLSLSTAVSHLLLPPPPPHPLDDSFSWLRTATGGRRCWRWCLTSPQAYHFCNLSMSWKCFGSQCRIWHGISLVKALKDTAMHI